MQNAGNLKELDAGAKERVGDFRDAARLTVREPFPGHFRPISECVERLIIDFRLWLEIQDDYRLLEFVNDGKHGRRKRIGRDVEKNNFNVLLLEAPSCVVRLKRRIYQSNINNFRAKVLEFQRNLILIAD